MLPIATSAHVLLTANKMGSLDETADGAMFPAAKGILVIFYLCSVLFIECHSPASAAESEAALIA